MNKIMNIYKIMLVSSIYTSKKSSVFKDIWKFACVFYTTLAMSCNLLLLALIIENNFYSNIFKDLEIIIVNNGANNFLINVLLYLFFPISVFNYFNVIYKNKYKNLINDYSAFYNKNIMTIYFLLSFFSPIIYVLSKVEIRL
jgi:hypothetical protein